MRRICVLTLLTGLLCFGGFPEIAKSAAQARLANRVPEAIRLYRQGLVLQPNWDEGWWYLGTLLYETDQYLDARDAFRRFVELKPKAGPGWALLGLCEWENKEFAAAGAHLVKAVDFGVGENEQLAHLVRLRAGILLAKFERYDIALKLLTSFGLQGKITPEVLKAAGIAALRMPLLPSELKPEKREMVELAGRGALAAGANNRAAARAALETLVAVYPRQPNVHYLYGSFLAGTDPDEALAEFRKELEISPDHVPAMVALSLELVKRGEIEPAIPLSRRAAGLSPNEFTARFAYGRSLLAAGRAGQAIVELEAAAKLRPDMPEAHFSLARAYQMVGRPGDADRARNTFRKLSQSGALR